LPHQERRVKDDASTFERLFAARRNCLDFSAPAGGASPMPERLTPATPITPLQ